MKKIIAIVLALLCLTSLVACGSKETFARGTTEENSYTNESLGLVFHLPDGWVFYTDDQLADLMGIVKDQIKDSNLLDNIDTKQIYEFMAVDNSTHSNISVSVEKVGAFVSEDQYIRQVKKLIPEQLPGYQVVFESDTAEVKLGDGTYTRLTASLKYQSISMTQYYYIRKVGNAMIDVVATTVSGEDSSYFEAMFSDVGRSGS